MKRTKIDNLIAGVRVPVGALAAAIHAVGQSLKRDFAKADLQDDPADPDCFAGTDCRLQVRGGSWQLHTGDSSYDQDHRGAWGANAIPWGCTWKEARGIAHELINDCADCAAQQSEGEESS